MEDRRHSPLTEVAARRHYSQTALYTASLRDPRFSSGFGMYPSSYKPKTGGSLAGVLFRFGFVGGLGIFLNQYFLYLLTSFYGIFYLVSAVLSSQAAILVSFLLNEAWVFKSRNGTGGLPRRIFLFNLVSSTDLVVRLPLLWGLTSLLNIFYLWSNLASILLTFLGRFLISEKKIWARCR